MKQIESQLKITAHFLGVLVCKIVGRSFHHTYDSSVVRFSRSTDNEFLRWKFHVVHSRVSSTRYHVSSERIHQFSFDSIA